MAVAIHTAPDLMPSELRRGAWLAGAIVAVVIIMVAHYWTDTSQTGLHNVYRRLAYIPIVVAAFSHGIKGGLSTAVAACLAYVPHAFFAHHRDPSPSVDKLLEMLLYIVIGGLTGYLVSRRDQARMALERSLKERDVLEQQLVRADKMSALGHMTAGLAHEIRNPLAAILGSAEALVADLDEQHRKREIGELLLSEIDRLDRVVRDFVRFGRPTPPERAEIDLVGLAERTVALAQSESRTRKIAMTVDVRSAIVVEADSDQIRQVLLNMLLNACQAIDAQDVRSGPGNVRVCFAERDVAGTRYLGVGVEDDGPGIPPERREAIFNPYYTTRPEGAGLGLAVSNRIVEAHGGFMDVEDEPRTTVWFFLPAESESR